MDEQLARLYDLIPDYLKGNLSKEDKNDVLAQIAIDSNFANEVEDQKELMLALEMYGQDGVVQEFDQLLREKIQSTSKIRSIRSPRVWLSVAAAVIGLLFLISYLSINSKTETAKVLAMEDFPDIVSDDYRPGGNGMTGYSTINDTFLIAMDFYSNEQYDSAKTYFILFKQARKRDNNAAFYLALCHINLNETDEATALLKSLDKGSGFTHYEEAQLRLAALYWQNGQYRESIKKLNKLKESKDSIIREKANKIW